MNKTGKIANLAREKSVVAISMKKNKSSMRDKILAAAVDVVGETGAGHLTLERVAASSGISKGGLLYHFANKRLLIEGMVARVLTDFESKIAEKVVQLEGVDNRTLKASIQVMSERSDAEKAQLRALLAASAENPGLLEPARRVLKKHFDTISSESGEPNAALALLLATEGIRFMELFDLLPLESSELDQILKKLWSMCIEVR